MQGEGLLNSRRTWWRNRVAVPLAFATALTQLALVPGAIPSARAATIEVDVFHDTSIPDGETTLREAIEAASNGDTINLPEGTYQLADGQLLINKNISIVGATAQAALVRIIGDPDSGGSRVFDLANDVSISNVLITGGSPNGRARGGGIQVRSGATVTLEGVQVGIEGAGNDAYEGGGIYNGGTLILSNSTVAHNSASAKGGGIENDGVLTAINSTVSGNIAKAGGGISTAGTAHLSFVTVWDNVSTNKIGAGTLRNGGTLAVRNSIVANNVGSDGDFHDCSGSPNLTNVIVTSSQGCNPDGPTYTFDAFNNGGVEALASALADNGGRTETHGLPFGSVAIDATAPDGLEGFNGVAGANCTTLADAPGEGLGDNVDYDQRGIARSDGFCDIGAYEFNITPPTVSAVANPAPNGAGWNNTNVVVTITGAPASEVTSLWYNLDDGAGDQEVVGENPTSVTISTESDSNSISYYAENFLGMTSSTATIDPIKIDKTAPTISAAVASTSPGPANTYYSDVGTTVVLTPTETLSGLATFEYSLTGGAPWTPYTAPIPITATSTVHYRATDVAGNASVAGTSITVPIDSTDPLVSISLDPVTPASGWYKASVDATVSASDGEAGIASDSYTLTGATIAGPTDYVSAVPISAEGTTYVDASATDGVGNVGDATQVPVRIDLSVPVITSPLNNATINQGVGTVYAYTCSDPGTLSGMASCVGDFAVGSTLNTNVAGNFSFSVVGTDNAGNVTNATFNYTVADITAPTVTATYNPTANSDGWNKSDVQVTLNATDNPGGSDVASIEFSTNGGTDWSTYGVPFTVSAEGSTTVGRRATDNSGNISAPAYDTLMIDKTLPTITANQATDVAGTPEASVQVELVPDDDIGVADGTLYFRTTHDDPDDPSEPVPGPWTLYAGPFVIDAVGTTTVDAKVMDVAGNEGVENVVVAIEIVPLDVTVALDTSVSTVEVGAVTVPIENIQTAILNALPPGTSTSSTPLTAIPLTAIPLTAIPLTAIPLTAIPLTAIPLTAIPLTAIPLTAIPLTAILLNEISTSDGGSIEPLLEGSVLQDTPLQSINFSDLVSTPLTAIHITSSPLTAIPLTAIPLTAIDTVIDCDAINCEDPSLTLGDAVAAGAFEGGTVGDVLTLDDLSFGATPLTAIPLTAIALAGLPLTAIPLTAIGTGGEELTGLDAWCEYLDCAALGIVPVDDPETEDPGTGDDWTLMTLSIAGIPLTAIPLTAIPLTAIPLTAIPLTAIPLTAIFWQSTPLTAIPLTAIVAESAPLTAIPLTAIPLTAIELIIDCDDGANAAYCDEAGTETLGDALGAILSSATLGQIAPYLESITIGDLDGLSSLDPYTLADLLYGLIPPAEIPWEEIDIEASRLPDAADPKQPTFDYEVDFSVLGSRSADVTITLDPPPGFLFARDLAEPVFLGTEAIEERPVEDADGVLTIVLAGLAPGAYELKLAMRAGLTLGVHQASVEADAVTAFVADGQTASAGPATADITVVQAGINEPGGGSHTRLAPLLTEGVLELAHVASDVDIDIYKFEVDGSSGFVGQSAKILLSNLPADYDLVLYGPPLAAPLRGDPQQGFDGVEDFIYDLNPDDEVLDTETLQDIPHYPEQVGLGPDDLPAGHHPVVLYAVSSKRGTNNEEIDTGTMQPGTYYVQVSSYNGAFSNDPYMIRLRVNEGVVPSCTVAPFNYATSSPGTLPPSYPADLNTIFLYNHARLNGVYSGDGDFGALEDQLDAIGTTAWSDLGVIGALVPVDGDPDVFDAFDVWNTDAESLCDPQAANDVVREIGLLIDDILELRPSVENIVIIGDDTMVPFARIPDGTAISNERTHGVGFLQVNETVGALLAGYYLSDDPYGADNGIAVNNHEFFVPTRAVGRLVETPGDIAQSLENFVTFNGLLDSSTGGVVSGYDFLTDGSLAVQANLEADAFSVTSLINETWTATGASNSLQSLLAGTFSVGSINAHFDQNRALPALGNSTHDESDLFEILDLPLFSNRLLFSMGCHSGLSLNDVQIGVPDWAQAFNANGNQWLANTGYGYGDSAIIGFSEWLNAEFAERIGELPAGQAFVAAKQAVAGSLYTIDPYHEKILQEFVFYGLPMFQTAPAAAAAAAAGPGGGGGATSGSSVAPTPFSALSLFRIAFFPVLGSGPVLLPDAVVPALDSTPVAIDLDATPGIPSGPGNLHLVTTPDGNYYEVDRETLVARGRPVQPLTGIDVTVPNGTGGLDAVAGGAMITHLAGYQDLAPNPLFATPTVDLGDGMDSDTTDWYRPEAGDATFPAGLQRIATYIDGEGQTRQRLLFAPGRFVENGPDLQELFTEMEAQVYYRDPASTDFVPPYIRTSVGWHTDSVAHGGIAYFEITVDGDGPVGGDDVARVNVMFREQGPVVPTPWLAVDLTRVAGTNRWVGGRPRGTFTDATFEFFVQAIDTNANIATAAAKGEFFLTSQPQDTGVITISLAGDGPVSGWFKSDVGATAEIASGDITGYRLDGGPIVPWDGGTPITDPLVITGLGGHFLQVYGTNDNVASAFLAIDTQGPIVDSSVSPDAVNGYRAPGAVVSIVATDPFGSGVASIEHCFDATGTDCASGGSGVWIPTLADSVDVDVLATTTVRYRGIDVVGNVGSEGTPQYVQIDDTPPTTVPAVSGGTRNAAGWYNTPIDVTFTATDTESGVASISHSQDDGATWVVVEGALAEILGLTTSTTILYFATDNVGNFEEDPSTFSPKSASLMIDVDPPVVTILSAEDEGVYQINEVILASYSCSDGTGSGVLPADCVGTVVNGAQVDTTTQGEHSFTVTATDQAGNLTEVTITYTVVDTIAPIVTVNTPPATPATYEVHEVVNADYTCSDVGVGGSGIASCEGTVGNGQPIDTSTLGTHSFSVTGIDNATGGGNETTVTRSYVVVDTGAPLAVITTPASGAVYEINASVTADYACTDPGGSGIASCSGPVADGTPVDTGTLGTHSFTVTATDLGGNVTIASHSYTVVDTTDPVVTITTPADEASYEIHDSIQADFSCTDSGLGGSGIASCVGTISEGGDLATSTLGTKYLTVTATDNAGNTTEVTHSYTVVDTNAPLAWITTPPQGVEGSPTTYEVNTVVLAGFGCSDSGGSGVASCVGTVAAGTPIHTGTIGTHSFTVTATDNGGNVTVVTHTYQVVDTTDPVVVITTPVDGASYLLGEAVLADFSCTDTGIGGSGIASCVGSAADGFPVDTSTVGAFDFTVTAVDLAGNTTVVTVSYSVGYNICLEYDAAAPQPATGTVPIKISLCDANDNVIKDPQTVITAVVVTDLYTGANLGPSPNDTGNANDGFEFRSQGGGRSYIYNLNVDELINADTGVSVELFASPSCDEVQPCFALGFVVNGTVTLEEIGSTGVFVPVAAPEDIVYVAEFTLKD